MVLLGVLVVRSDHFPRILGALLGAAGVAYLVESFTYIVAPGGAEGAAAVLVPTAGIAEVSFCIWLLLRGVRSRPTGGH
jgi:hypothetical protein